MKRSWITLGILPVYAVLTVILTFGAVCFFNLLGEVDPMPNAFAVLTVPAFIGIRRANSEHKLVQCAAVQSNKGV